MFNQSKIQRIILLPFFTCLFLLASVFLVACACQPSKGDRVVIKTVSLDAQQKIAKTLAPSSMTKRLIVDVSNRLFNQGQYQSQVPLLIQKLEAEKHPSLAKFRPVFFAKTNNRFNPIHFVSQQIYTDPKTSKEYPEELILLANDQKTTKDVAVELQYFFADTWQIKIIISQIRFSFPAVNAEKPALRFANQFNFLNSANKKVSKLSLDQFTVRLVQI